MSRVCSIFSQLLQFFPRLEFEQAVRETRAERHARGFTCWGQFVAMLFCQLGQARSLREICGGLAGCEGKLKHLGVPQAPNKSTLAYANEHRPWQLYQRVFNTLFARCQQAASGRRKFQFRNPLLSIDGTLIDLCATMFDWAQYQQGKGAAKLHMVLDHDGYLPRFAVLTEGSASEVKIAREFDFSPGTIVVFDRGYVDYRWYQRLVEDGVFFVTRMRHDAHYRVLQRRPVPENRNIRKDEMIQLGSPHYRQGACLRRIEIWSEQHQQMLVLLTNHLAFGSTTIARIYRDRWQIEVFFRCLKQNLRIKTFVGTSANALHIQIWTALIAILLLKYLQLRASFGWSLSNLVALLRQQLFVYRDLHHWLNEPYQAPPALAGLHDSQLPLQFSVTI
ncbi:MAG TPA: IS4 family transposase [Terriglobales bacterium]